jgi:diguanylate cyclase (GGDEF)-like protein
MILVVEDSRTFGSMVKKRLEARLDVEVVWLQNFADAKALLAENPTQFRVAVCDLTLPDAPNGEIVDLTTSLDIATVVLTASFDEVQRERMWSKKVCDYVLKRGPHDMEYVVSLVRRLSLNPAIKVMVVYDSKVLREHVVELLRVHRYEVIEAVDGLDAIEVLKNNPDVRMVVTDYAMPRMDGLELSELIRRNVPKDELCIIGVSAVGDNRLAAMFIKNGANDFIFSPFQSEEFYCRVTQNIELLEKIEAIRYSATRDYLTGLYNRRHFFEVGHTLFANARRVNVPIALAMVDLDHFKSVNDTYGHDIGDEVLRTAANALRQRVREADLLARFGGEEFCIMATNIDENQSQVLFDEMRAMLSEIDIPVDNEIIHVTASFGVCAGVRDSLEEMIKVADEQLYNAKEAGRNRVIVATESQA